jgi:hypothetical protein
MRFDENNEVAESSAMILPQSKLPLTSKLTRSLKSCAFAAFLMCVRLKRVNGLKR